MKVLVTGGAGFIGSHVVEQLLNSNYEVVVIDNLVTGNLNNLQEDVSFYNMDLNDSNLEDVFKLEKPNYVIHMAAQASVMTSMNDPYLDFSTNTDGTLKLLLLCQKNNIRRLLFASTAAVYGEPSYLPVDESHPIDPQSFYSLSKYSAENYISCNRRINGLNSCILRFSNVYGPRQNPSSEAGVISIFINNLLSDKEVNIYDGSQTRDFIYVKDVARACQLALETDHEGIFNVSSCSETVIDDLYYLIKELTGIDMDPVYSTRRNGEIRNSVLDNQKACSHFNWKAQYTLFKGLEETIEYYLEQYSTKITKTKIS